MIASQEIFFEPNNFRQAISAAERTATESDISAIVVPQHLLASSLIAQQFKRASGRAISTVVIIGPNHENSSASTLATTTAAWETAFGNVESEADLVAALSSGTGALFQTDAFKNEHAIGAVIPFVRHYFPDAHIVPLTYNSYATMSDVENVAQWLNGNLPKHSLVVFSIDFSHYLSRELADQKDVETRALIEGKNTTAIMALGNDHVDSPASLVTALRLAETKPWSMEILDVKNSDDFSVERTPETTSYFVIVWRQ